MRHELKEWSARFRLALFIGAVLLVLPLYLTYFALVLRWSGVVTFWAPLP